eukprot:505975-Pyramimonas_sp.AAC.1
MGGSLVRGWCNAGATRQPAVVACVASGRGASGPCHMGGEHGERVTSLAYPPDFRGGQIKNSKSDAEFQNLIREREQMEGRARWAGV